MAAPPVIRRAVFIRTDRLGETLLNVPAVSALHAALPAAQIDLLVHPGLVDLMARVPGVRRALPCPTGRRALWWRRALLLGRRLRSAYDLALVSNPMKELHVAVWLAGIPIRAGYDRKCGWALTHRLADDGKALGGRHEVEYNLDLLRVVGLPTAVPEWRFPPFEREQLEALQLLERLGLGASEPFIAVHPWTSDPRKQWGVDRYRALIRRVRARLGVGVAVIGGSEARGEAEAVCGTADHVANLVGRLSLTQLAGFLQRARLLVSNDSGPVHVSAAVGTPTLVLFGGTDPATGPGRWGPWGSGHRVIEQRSMDLITVEEAFAALQEQLHAHTPAHPDRESVRDR